jgi:integrase
VFPGQGPSGHKALDQFSRQFKKTVRKWTGLDVNIHLMRHIGAKLYLDENPGAYEVVRRLLGHKSLSTTVNNYTGLEIESAVKHFDAVILGIRDAIGRSVGYA